jgi:hypothetical protein
MKGIVLGWHLLSLNLGKKMAYSPDPVGEYYRITGRKHRIIWIKPIQMTSKAPYRVYPVK